MNLQFEEKYKLKRDSESSTEEISNLPLNCNRKFFNLLFISTLIFTSGIIISLFVSYFIYNELSLFSFKNDKSVLEIHWTFSLSIMIILVVINVSYQTKYLLFQDDEFMLCIYKNSTYNTFFSNILSSSYIKILAMLKSTNKKLLFSILLTISMANIGKYILNKGFIYPNYKIIKRKRFTTFLTYLTFFVYISLYLLFSMYLFLYSLINFIYYVGGFTDSSELILNFSIIIVFSLCSVVLLAYYKDVFFSLFFLQVLEGYLINSIKEERVFIYILILLLLFMAVIFTSIKYRNSAFGIPEDKDYTELIRTYKRINNNL